MRRREKAQVWSAVGGVRGRERGAGGAQQPAGAGLAGASLGPAPPAPRAAEAHAGAHRGGQQALFKDFNESPGSLD